MFKISFLTLFTLVFWFIFVVKIMNFIFANAVLNKEQENIYVKLSFLI